MGVHTHTHMHAHTTTDAKHKSALKFIFGITVMPLIRTKEQCYFLTDTV